MSAEQGNNRNRLTIRLCVYALLVAICIVLGFLESLLPLGVIAPGVKIGLANAVALLLIASGDTKGAMFVNIARVLLTTLLFSTPFALTFSLSGAAVSLLGAALLYRVKSVSIIGMSIAAAVLHNLAQLCVAFFVVGRGVLLYTPVLILSGGVCGAVVGIICSIILKKVKTNAKI